MGVKSRKMQQEFGGVGFRKPGDCFGGALLKGNAKMRRPLESKFPIHLTLRANKSVLRYPKTFGKVQVLIAEVARKHGVTVYSHANVGNHLHLAIKLSRVHRWAGFIRELTGRLALACRQYVGTEGMWMFRPHTRIVRGWKKAFASLKEYIQLNQLEADGFISRKETKSLRDLRRILGTE